MDPLHPIVPITPGIGPVNPLPSTRRVNPDAQRERAGERRRGDQREGKHGGPGPDADGPDGAPRIDITA